MRSEYGYAWGKLYLAMRAMAISTAPLPRRVADAFRSHLLSLGPHNLPPAQHERFKLMRATLAASPDDADEDHTFEFAVLSPEQAVALADEIFSLYDEIARHTARAGAA
jgi:hypothetical protein